MNYKTIHVKQHKSPKTLLKTFLYWISELNISHGSTFDDTSTKHQHYGEISSFDTRAIAGCPSCPLFYFSSCRSWRIPVFVPGTNPLFSHFSWIIIGACWIEWKVCRRTVKSLRMTNYKIYLFSFEQIKVESFTLSCRFSNNQGWCCVGCVSYCLRKYSLWIWNI